MLGLGLNFGSSESGSSAARMGGPALLLDTYSGAAAAYSLRRLATGHNKALQIRRELDNTEVDVYFDTNGVVSLNSTVADVTEETTGSNTTLTTAAANLGEFVFASGYTNVDGLARGSSALVQCWYDQSGNRDDATQVTAGSQPQIVSAGVLVVENGRPAIDFQTDVLYTSGSITLSDGAYLSLCVATTNGGQNNVVNASDGSPRVGQFVRTSSSNAIQSIGFNSSGGVVAASGPTASVDTQFLGIGECTGTQLTAYLNGTGGTSTGHTNRTDSAPFYVGARKTNAGDAQNGYVQEVIHYPSNQSGARPGIETNINTFYSIY